MDASQTDGVVACTARPAPRPPDLPIAAHQAELLAAIKQHSVIVVAGDTGSGKSTQLPQYLLECGLTAIAHTQPRRLAARAIAARVAEELREPLGQRVGYKVRFDQCTSAATQLTLMTDGCCSSRHRTTKT